MAVDRLVSYRHNPPKPLISLSYLETFAKFRQFNRSLGSLTLELGDREPGEVLESLDREVGMKEVIGITSLKYQLVDQGTSKVSLIHLFSQIVGHKNLLIGQALEKRFAANTLGIQRQILGAIQVTSAEQVCQVMKLAQSLRVNIYPISTGKNWGYGSALPVQDRCWILDLSRINRILEFDSELGIIRVEPGVTQQDLYDFLKHKGSEYFVPTTGAGPQCSLIGNALEKGYGLTPYADHFQALTHLDVVLPTGERLASPLSELGGSKVDQLFKWGLGPYLDGLFSQSNMGVVVSATIKLAKKPECMDAVIFTCTRKESLPHIVAGVKKIKEELGDLCSGINLMNDRRVLAMSTPRQEAGLQDNGLLSEEWVGQQIKRRRLGHWMGLGALYLPKSLRGGARKLIRQHLGQHVDQLHIFSFESLETLGQLLEKPLLRTWFSHHRESLSMLRKGLKILSGQPTEAALPLAYWMTGKRPNSPMDPARDGCGLLWYSPLVPLRAKDFQAYTKEVKKICSHYGVEPLITMTTISESCFDSTVPILFDPKEPGAKERAHGCYQALLEMGMKRGWVPYRLNIKSLKMGVFPKSTSEVLSKIKKALDPGEILAPGRYQSITRKR